MKILLVDDNQKVLAAFRRNLQLRFEAVTVGSGDAALRALEEEGPFAVIVSDMRMPGMNGIEFLEKAFEIAPDTVRIMLTGNADQDTAVDAVNRGHVYRFLNKPCSVEELVQTLDEAVKEYEAGQVEHRQLEKTVAGCVKVLSDVLGMVAPFALGRGQRLQDCISPFVKTVKLKAVWQYEVSALLSAIGYTSFPTSVITKLEGGEKLSAGEASIVRKAPQIGHDLVVAVPRLERVALNIKYQRKNYDGSGFPEDERAGQDIPLGARVLRIFEDRMALEREGIGKDAAFAKMRSRIGAYDPKILELCFRYYPNYLNSSISKEKPVLTLSLDALKPGHVIVSDLSTTDGVLLVEAGNRLTAATIQRIRNYAILEQVTGPFYVQSAGSN